MRERPILFSGPMVRAILAGTKTQTRRVVKPQPWASCCIEEGMDGEAPFVYSALTGDGPGYDVDEVRTPCRCPYGAPGDRLWVREAWGIGSRTDPWGGYDGIEYRADEAWLEDGDLLPCHKVSTPDDVCLGDYRAGWKPSIHMPRWASRITLEITGVRVERLQDISVEDCRAEGGMYDSPVDVRAWYRDLWESINGPGSWDANPWVWVVEFRRLDTSAGCVESNPESGHD